MKAKSDLGHLEQTQPNINQYEELSNVRYALKQTIVQDGAETNIGNTVRDADKRDTNMKNAQIDQNA